MTGGIIMAGLYEPLTLAPESLNPQNPMEEIQCVTLATCSSWRSSRPPL